MFFFFWVGVLFVYLGFMAGWGWVGAAVWVSAASSCLVWMGSCGGLWRSSSARVLIKARRVPGLQSPMGKRLRRSDSETLLLPVEFGSFYFSFLIMQNRRTLFCFCFCYFFL